MSGLFVVAALVAVLLLPTVFIFTVTGQPPRHCKYMVAVKDHPGVYACSQYPRPKVKP